MHQKMISKILKTFSLSLFALAPPRSFSYAGRDSLRKIHDVPSSLVRTLTSDTCMEDMKQMELSSNLAIALQMSLNSFIEDFETRPMEYCHSRINSGRTASDCLINFEKFTPTYRLMCHNAEAQFFPISLLMNCRNDDIDLEMELVNIPSCLAHTCNDNEITKAVENMIASPDDQDAGGLSCELFHRTVGVPVAASNAMVGTKSIGYSLILVGTLIVGFSTV